MGFGPGDESTREEVRPRVDGGMVDRSSSVFNTIRDFVLDRVKDEINLISFTLTISILGGDESWNWMNFLK
jgi:hypothetical protein